MSTWITRTAAWVVTSGSMALTYADGAARTPASLLAQRRGRRPARPAARQLA